MKCSKLRTWCVSTKPPWRRMVAFLYSIYSPFSPKFWNVSNSHTFRNQHSLSLVKNCLNFIDYFRRVTCNSFATLRSLAVVSCLFFFPNLALFLNFLSSPLHYTGHSNKLIGYFIGAPHIIHNCRNVRAALFTVFPQAVRFFQSQQQGVDFAATATDCVTTIIARSS